MILAIMNKIKHRPILLYSMIGIKNIRLEQLALGQCHSIDLTCDYFDTSYEYEKFIRKFILFTLPCIFNHIKSLTIDIIHVSALDGMTQRMKNKTCLNNLKHLKIMAGRLNCNTGIHFRTGNSFRSDEFFLEAVLPEISMPVFYMMNKFI
jgi:hypothetical protein